MPAHIIDSTSTSTALPSPDAPSLAASDLLAAVAQYQLRERTAADKQLAVPDADVRAVRDAVPGILAKYRNALVAVNENTDLSAVGRARQRAALLEGQKGELAALAPRLRDAKVRAETFGVPDPPTEADSREVAEILRTKGELAPRYLLAALGERLKSAASSGEGPGTFRKLLPYLRSWHEMDGPLHDNRDLWTLINCIEGVTPEGERTGGLTVDRHTLYAEARLREVTQTMFSLDELVSKGDSVAYAQWGATPPPEPALDRGALAAASLGPAEAQLFAK